MDPCFFNTINSIFPSRFYCFKILSNYFFILTKNIISSSIIVISGECIGINVDNGELMDASEAQIYDHILIKDWQIRLGKNY